MVNESYYKADIDELVFASKNKEYGSYELRKAYRTYLTVAMWIAILVFVLVTTGSTIYRIINPEDITLPNKPVITVPIDLTHIPSIKENKNETVVKAPPLKATIKFTPPVTKPDNLVTDEYIIPTKDELTNVDPGINTEEGVEGGYDYSLDDIEEVVVEEVIKRDEFFHWVEEMPEPIGGTKGIMGKIIYPEIAKRAGVEGRVVILAFVDESGTVTKAEIVKSIGAGCDEAALDAVMKTKFKPGKQNGNPVKVQVSVPIIFKLQ